MKLTLLFLVMSVSFCLYAQDQKPDQKPPATLKSVLLAQLQSTHNKAEWFVPANTAVAGLTAEQASWKDNKGNHSVGQLAYHLVFWDREELKKFKGDPPDKYSGKNDDTFDNFDAKQWNDIVKQLDSVMTEWEKAVEGADDQKLRGWAEDIAHVGTHNAYHIGQIVYVRREQGSWDPEKGVK